MPVYVSLFKKQKNDRDFETSAIFDGFLFIFGEPTAMCLNEIIAKRNDVINRELGGSVGIHHSRLIDRILFLGYCGLDRHKLNVYVCSVHSGADLREIADDGGLDSLI